MPKVWLEPNQLTPLPERSGGIELISDRTKPLTEFSRVELQDFLKRLEADKFTLQRYHGVKQLRAWEALALHHNFDPSVLSLNHRRRVTELTQIAYQLLPNSYRLLDFISRLEPMVEVLKSGDLACINTSRDLLQSFVDIDQFKYFDCLYPLLGHLPQKRSRETVSPLVDSTVRHRVIEDLERGLEFWKTSENGGDYIPGDYSSEPDLVPFFRSLNYSVNKSKIMAAVLKPAQAHVGRPPKGQRRRTSFQSSSGGK